MFKKDPLQIIAFQSYGTKTHLYLRGRALEDESIDLSKKGFLSLLRNTWKRFETDEVRHETLKIQLPNEQVLYSDTNSEGYYLVDEQTNDLTDSINEEGWLNYEIAYDVFKDKLINLENRFPGEMLIPSESSKFGVISDIDDTLLETGVVSKLKWKVLVNSLFKHAENRMAFAGAATIYSKLHQGISGEEANPIFYVSNSPWNLYRYLEYFLKHNNFPKGPILLRDFRTPFDKTKKRKESHKEHEIKNIIKTYPNKKFVLIGDAGEHDIDIYLDIVKHFPNRIKTIYIRTVNHKKRMLRIQRLIKDYTNVPVLLFKDSEEVLEHARKLRLIC
ncbi:App1 family protein [Croceibacter atlanticus]|uniref:App1 family protein n=1 Tax=Croceibacter atlanticus TaxID=313588 RepID=UPI0023570349|nr:phosphatase domain-containing protein [Croceibacter atlanticus]|tara:strand:- start:445 stop:1440 length:996 start_codon:yes stop_codon:yes gene_type:complete